MPEKSVTLREVTPTNFKACVDMTVNDNQLEFVAPNVYSLARARVNMKKRGMHIAPDELRCIKDRLEEEDLTVLGYCFEGDSFCPAERFAEYREALGFEVVQETSFDNNPLVDQAIGLTAAKAQMAMLKGPNAFIEIWQYENPESEDLRSRPCDYGYPHFALQVDDIQAEYDRLQQHGMEFVGEVVHFGETSSAIYGRDPCGNIIELYEIKTPAIAQLERRGQGTPAS